MRGQSIKNERDRKGSRTYSTTLPSSFCITWKKLICQPSSSVSFKPESEGVYVIRLPCWCPLLRKRSPSALRAEVSNRGMPAFPGCAGTPRAGQPFRQGHMLGGPGLARIRAGTCHRWGHPLAEEGKKVDQFDDTKKYRIGE